MTPLKSLTLYREQFNENYRGDAQSVRDNCGVMDANQALMVIKYMNKGVHLFDFMGPTLDPLTGRWDVPHFYATDGTYVWDGVLLRWIEQHYIRLPSEFIEHIRGQTGDWVEKAKANEIELAASLKSAELIVFSEVHKKQI